MVINLYKVSIYHIELNIRIMVFSNSNLQVHQMNKDYQNYILFIQKIRESLNF